MKDRDKDHYSNGGGHKERAQYNKEAIAWAIIMKEDLKFHPRRSTFNLPVAPLVDQARMRIRNMRRVTRSGR